MAESQHSKIVLPTPETCSWRSECDDGTASCGLLGSVIGKAGPWNEVSQEHCQACCETFPPTPRRLNPVVASMLYSRLAGMNEADSTNGLAASHVEKLMAIAKRTLTAEHSPGEPWFPLRASRPCCFLGPPKESGQLNSETIFDCHHPAHEHTTDARCKLCHDWSHEIPISDKLKLREIVPLPRRSGNVRYWAVGVTTSPRRQSTLGICLDGLVRAGWSDIHLFLDGTVRVPREHSHLPTTWREHAVGACPAWSLSLAELVSLHPDADAYAMFQDDVFPHDGDSLREYLEDALWPNRSDVLVSLYNPGLVTRRGWHTLPSDWDWGTLAVVFPPQLARAFLSDASVVRRSLPTEAGQHRPIPEVVREWVHRRQISVSYPNPSLTQHIGLTSTIWAGAGLGAHRRAPWFSTDLEAPTPAQETLADFDESAFPCSSQDESRYRELVTRGRDRMRDLSVLICGICRDARPYLPRTAARIQKLGSMFADYRVVLFENDSTDRTLDFLEDWQRQDARVEVTSERLGTPKFGQTRSPARASALAECRNRYVDVLRKKFDSYSHVIVVDCDLVGGWSYEGIANSFGHQDWDFMGSYGLDHLPTPPKKPPRRFHYDRWAFRAARDSAASVLIGKHQDSLRRGMPLLEVESCFGGLGIYQTRCLLECQYGGEDCEHVTLHRSMRQAGFARLYLNPSQIVLRSALVH